MKNPSIYISCPVNTGLDLLHKVEQEILKRVGKDIRIKYWDRNNPNMYTDKWIKDASAVVFMLPHTDKEKLAFRHQINTLPSGLQKEYKACKDQNKEIFVAYIRLGGDIKIYEANSPKGYELRGSAKGSTKFDELIKDIKPKEEKPYNSIYKVGNRYEDADDSGIVFEITEEDKEEYAFVIGDKIINNEVKHRGIFIKKHILDSCWNLIDDTPKPLYNVGDIRISKDGDTKMEITDIKKYGSTFNYKYKLSYNKSNNNTFINSVCDEDYITNIYPTPENKEEMKEKIKLKVGDILDSKNNDGSYIVITNISLYPNNDNKVAYHYNKYTKNHTKILYNSNYYEGILKLYNLRDTLPESPSEPLPKYKPRFSIGDIIELDSLTMISNPYKISTIVEDSYIVTYYVNGDLHSTSKNIKKTDEKYCISNQQYGPQEDIKPEIKQESHKFDVGDVVEYISYKTTPILIKNIVDNKYIYEYINNKGEIVNSSSEIKWFDYHYKLSDQKYEVINNIVETKDKSLPLLIM